MLHKTRAIILRHIKYSESSIIVHSITELFGKQAYIVSGVRSKKSGNRINQFQPLHILEMDVYYKPNRELQRIKECKPLVNLTNISTDPLKSCQAIFLAEIISKSIKGEEKNPELFEFIFNSIQLLDLSQNNTANFHLLFLINFAKFLGFYPRNNYNNTNNIFDLRAGSFCSKQPLHNEYMPDDISLILNKLLKLSMKDYFKIKLNSRTRSELLEHIIDYYYLHIEGMPKIKSFSVLTEVFSDI